MEVSILNLMVTYLDYRTASVAEREPFSFAASQLPALYERILAAEGVLGAVLISTCNRTELYLSLEEGVEIQPFALLCPVGVPADQVSYQTRVGNEAVWHLFSVAAGARSQIWGEDQILAQVKAAILLAREAQAADAVLEVLFRLAISGAKRVKTMLGFQELRDGTGERAVQFLCEQGCERVLVIGNGMIGRHIATLLLQAGKQVTMTLRHYRHGPNVIPDGVKTVHYDDRYTCMVDCDAVVSATSSPHHTVRTAAVEILPMRPRCFVDLAVPRDIESAVATLPHVLCRNIDQLSEGGIQQNRVEGWRAMEPILAPYLHELKRWETKRQQYNTNRRTHA